MIFRKSIAALSVEADGRELNGWSQPVFSNPGMSLKDLAVVNCCLVS